MEASHAISFVKITGEQRSMNNQPDTSTSSTITGSAVMDDDIIQSTLKKVASDANVEDIDVEDCRLTQDERLTLYTRCRDFFDSDAWIAVGHNSKDLSNTAKDLIFPLYTETEDEHFWLFYCPGQTLCDIYNARPSTRFSGYWLDLKEAGDKYTVLTALAGIKVKWIVKTDHGPLYYEKSLDVGANDSAFELPTIFKSCIRATLQKDGLLGV